MIPTLYLITFIAAVTVLLALVFSHKRVLTTALIFGVLVVLNSFGRYLITVAQSFETARLGNLLLYLGGCFCPLIVSFILSDLCKVHFPLWLKKLMVVTGSIIFAMAISIGHFDFYYKSIEFVRIDGVGYLKKEYGPAHSLYSVYMAVVFLMILICLVQGLRHRKEISVWTVVNISLLSFIIFVSYAAQRILHTRISFTSVGYLLAMILFMHLLGRLNIYDLPTNIANCIDLEDEHGYVEFDLQYRCTGYNDRFRQLFPEVETKWRVDSKIQPDKSFLYQEIILWLFRRKKDERKTIQLGERYYEMFVREIPYRNRCVGYMLELVDRTDSNRYTATMEHYNENLKKEVRIQTGHISHIKDMLVVGMASMVESRDNSTGGHIRRTSRVMEIFTQHLLPHCGELGLTPHFLDMMTRAAPMHDLGKIAVDDAVLRKQGKFTPEEFSEMKKHSQEGARIVRSILTGVEPKDFVDLAENVAHYHHEKWNGRGYPQGLAGKEIPIEARIMALADVFDALVSRRCYKEAFSYDKAFSIIENDLGSHFDPVLGRLFMECRPQLEELYNRWNAEDAQVLLPEQEKTCEDCPILTC